MKKFHFDLIVSSIVLVAMIVVILIQIIFRLMGNPLSWTEEVARWMLVWATFAGASYAFKNGGLIRVDFFVKKLFKKKGRRITDIAAMMFMIVYFGLLGVSAASYMKMTISKGQTYPITQVPYAITLISLVYCGLSCCIFAVKEGLKAYHSTDTQEEGGKCINVFFDRNLNFVFTSAAFTVSERPSGCLHRTAYRTYNAWQWDEGGHISPENVCFC